MNVEKEAPPSKDVEMEQHDEEQHAEQTVELLAIGSEVEYKSGETGPNINVLIAQQEFRALVDTGASISCLSEAFISELNIKYTKNSSYEASSVSGAQLHVLGETYINFLINSCFFSHKFLIIKNINQNLILGRDFLCKNNCLIDFSKNHLILKTRFIVKFINTGTLENDRSESNIMTDNHHSDKNNVKITDIDNNGNKINYNNNSRNVMNVNNVRNKVSRKGSKRYVPKHKKNYNLASSEIVQRRQTRSKDYKKSKIRKHNNDNRYCPTEGRIDTQYKKRIQLRNIDNNLVFLNKQNVNKFKYRKRCG
ncbi:probable serine/threonine-protein kinase dyrk1 isoform X2 [Helicoverpa zea]|uniref:probable serine/threonine-protein kinase dyrk1 isoform X2 n=1 Tax=Helicoverpa zea TaxID=7113 RepID=UPI001F56FFE7|nr:probable serine/threonine-protein kinase dyrk1 isoform X2 [Helicoverpa zea]